jgi:hypothetical protein
MAAPSSLGLVTHAVVDAAKAAVETTTDYVVEPIGKVLGLIPDAPEAPAVPAEKPQPKAARKAARKAIVARAEAAVAADKAARRRRRK